MQLLSRRASPGKALPRAVGSQWWVQGQHPLCSETDEGQGHQFRDSVKKQKQEKKQGRSVLRLRWDPEHIPSRARLLGTRWGQAAGLVWEPAAASLR